MSMTNGSDPEDLAADMARLEAALERIDYLSGVVAQPPAPSAPSSAVVASEAHETVPPEVIHRLDSMIARLRAAIDEA